MFDISDTIYKNVGIAVCITFLVYVLISVVRIQFDVGNRIAAYGSGIIKEGFGEMSNGKKSSSNGVEMGENYEENSNKIQKLIDDIETKALDNFKYAGIDYTTDKDGKLSDPKKTKNRIRLVHELLYAKSTELLSENIKNFVNKGGDIDLNASSDVNNTITLLDTLMKELSKNL